MGRQKGKKEWGENNIYLVSDVCDTSLFYKWGTDWSTKEVEWSQLTDAFLPSHFLISIFLIKKCLWSWVKQGRETDSMPLTQEIMARREASFWQSKAQDGTAPFPAPFPQIKKYWRRMSSHRTLLTWRKQTERVKHQYWGSSWKHLS